MCGRLTAVQFPNPTTSLLTLLVAATTLYLAGCKKQEADVATPAQAPQEVPAVKGGPEPIPQGNPAQTPRHVRRPQGRDPMVSMQPLRPGLSWTYDMKISQDPWIFRSISSDVEHGALYVAKQERAPMNESSAVGSRVRFTVIDETQNLRAELGRVLFYRIKKETFDKGKWTDVDNGLYWGRGRIDLESYVIYEMRDATPATSSMDEGLKSALLRNVNDVLNPEGLPIFHSRILGADIGVHDDIPSLIRAGTFSLGRVHLQLKDRWEFDSETKWGTILVPAGTFPTIKSTLVFSGAHKMNTTDELYYSLGIGLTKWVQSSDGHVRWTAELSSHNVPPLRGRKFADGELPQ